jgi:hypothetical protein
MSNEEKWLRPYEALALVSRDGCSVGAARAKVLAAMDSGTVRIRRSIENSRGRTLSEINPKEVGRITWAPPGIRKTSTYFYTPEMVEPEEHCTEIAESDFLYWLDSVEPVPPKVDVSKDNEIHREALVKSSRPPRGDKGGARRSNLKDEVLWEVIRIADLDALPDDPRELTKHLKAWCHAKWGDAEPTSRTLQNWVNEIYSAKLRG